MNDIEYIEYIKLLNYQEKNHIHLLEGFINLDNNDRYIIDKIDLKINDLNVKYNFIIPFKCSDKNKKSIEDKLILYILKNFVHKNDKKIEYPLDFSIQNIKLYDIFITGKTYNHKKEIYNIKLFNYQAEQNMYKMNKYMTKMDELENNKDNSNMIMVQTGGKKISEIDPNICINVLISKPTGIVEIYSEPTINLITSAFHNVLRSINLSHIDPLSFEYVGNKDYYKSQRINQSYFKLIPERVFDDKYDKMFDSIKHELTSVSRYTDKEIYKSAIKNFSNETFENGSWKHRIMFDHLMEHKYAHNGIDKENFITIAEILTNLQLDDQINVWTGLHFIHSYLHIYDLIYMVKQNTSDFYRCQQYIKELKQMFVNEQQQDCFNFKLNINRYEFLIKGSNGEYDLPYHIKSEALADKDRQYYNDSDLMNEFNNDIIQYPYSRTGSTIFGPNQNNV
jgi:hypothetical protein